MLPDTIDPGKSLLENESHRLNLIRWMHQCELMKRYYQADKVFVLQKTDQGFEVIVSAADASHRFPPGKVFSADESVFQRMVDSPPEGVNLDLTRSTNDDNPKEFSNVLGILSRPVLWPDGSVFGCLCVINAHANEQQHISPICWSRSKFCCSKTWRSYARVTELSRCPCVTGKPACSTTTALS